MPTRRGALKQPIVKALQSNAAWVDTYNLTGELHVPELLEHDTDEREAMDDVISVSVLNTAALVYAHCGFGSDCGARLRRRNMMRAGEKCEYQSTFLTWTYV